LHDVLSSARSELRTSALGRMKLTVIIRAKWDSATSKLGIAKPLRRTRVSSKFAASECWLRGGDEYLGKRGGGDLVAEKDIYGAMRRYVVTSSGILDVMIRYVSSSNVVYNRRCL
jgi:hypothetical protein